MGPRRKSERRNTVVVLGDIVRVPVHRGGQILLKAMRVPMGLNEGCVFLNR